MALITRKHTEISEMNVAASFISAECYCMAT